MKSNQRKRNILVVDDDLEFCRLLTAFLEKNSYNAVTTADPDSVLDSIKEKSIHLLIANKLMPKEDGMSLCRRVRYHHKTLPILMLTSVTDDLEEIVALETNIDQYVHKPVNLRMLLAYIKVLIESPVVGTRLADTKEKTAPTVCYKKINTQQKIYHFSQWRLNALSHTLISANDREVPLTAGEYKLLEVFVQRPRCVLRREFLLNVTKTDLDSFERSVDVLISRLRHKLRVDGNDVEIIKTVRNEGYLLEAAVELLETAQ